jgi:signal transduction histidine kinase
MVTAPRFEDLLGRVVPEPYHDRLGAALIVVVGLSSGLFHLRQLAGGERDPVVFLVGAFSPLVLSILLIIGGVWIHRSGYDGLGLRVGGWCLVGAGILAGISLLTVQYQAARGVELRDMGVVVVASATGGSVVGFLIGIYDAERKRNERRMASERRKAERLGQRLTVLNRVLRHDIRNDVNVIHGNADRILDGAGADEPARTIKRKAMRLNRLSESAREVESLLSHGECPTEPVDITSLLKEERRGMTRYGDVDIETSIPDGVWVSASPKIETAIGHLVENAVEHNDSASPRIRIEAAVEESHVELRVIDNGPGLPEEEIRVLERGHETEIEHASGVGLWLANWIVTESGGEITFERDESRGSVVTVRLPRATPAA